MDEWDLAIESIKRTVEALDVRYFSLVQFSTGAPVDHIKNFNVQQRGKAEAVQLIQVIFKSETESPNSNLG